MPSGRKPLLRRARGQSSVLAAAAASMMVATVLLCGGTWCPGRAVLADQLVGAGGGEHIPRPADQFGHRGGVQAQPRHRVGKPVSEPCGLVGGQDHRRQHPVGMPCARCWG